MAGRDAFRGRAAPHRGLVPRPGARAGRARRRRPALSGPAPLFSVLVPTRGEEAKLARLLDAIDRQTLPRSDWELIVAFDGVAPGAALRSRLDDVGARVVVLPRRSGPGAARNAAAREARGSWLAFTEDDCVPAPDWLERAAARIRSEPDLDLIEGETRTPQGSPVRRRDEGRPTYLPTNLFVRRSMYDRAGGYREDYFDPSSGLYFREDSDFGFRLEALRARAALEASAVVTHPAEHPRLLDPIRWARRYEMDALLERRHPERARSRIERVRLGPFTIRRVVLRASFGYVLAVLAALGAWAAGERGAAALLGAAAGVAFLPVWGKWRFDPRRLPVALVVPFVLTVSYVRGFLRARGRPEP